MQPPVPQVCQQPAAAPMEKRHKACTECQRSKLKCLPQDPPIDSLVCLRCARYKLHCEYSQRRPNARTNPYDRLGRPRSIPPSSYTHQAPTERSVKPTPSTQVGQASHWALPAHELSDSGQVAAAWSQTSPAVSATGPATHSPVASTASAGTTKASPKTQSAAPPTDVASILFNLQRTFRSAAVPAQETVPPLHPVQAALDTYDPVGLGDLSAYEATRMYNTFLEEHNSYIALLDEHLHTEAYVRQCEPILYLAVLTAVAKTERIAVYATLKQNRDVLFGQAFAAGWATVDLAQALSIAAAWRDPEDKSAYLWIGHAIRVAQEIAIDQPPRRPLPIDANEARRQINGERTWLQLRTADRTLQHLFNRTRSTSSYGHFDSDAWIVDHGEFVSYADAMLAASQMGGQVFATVRLAINHLGTCQADHDFAHMALHSVLPVLETWEKTWANQPTPAALSENSQRMIGYYTVANRLRVSELRFKLNDNSKGDPLIGPDGVIHHGLEVLRYAVHQIVPTRVFAFAPDLVLLQCAGIGCSLIKHWMKLPEILQLEAVTLLEALRTACRLHTSGNDNQHFHAIFLDGILRLQDGQSRGGSRATSPRPEHANSGTDTSDFGTDFLLQEQVYGEFDIDAELQRLMSDARDCFPMGVATSNTWFV